MPITKNASKKSLWGTKALLVLLMFVCAAQNLSAYNFEVDGIYYNRDAASQTATVTYRALYTQSYSGVVNIPENVEYDGVVYTVTAIGEQAFNDCTDLTEVTIPSSLTEIGSRAFSYFI